MARQVRLETPEPIPSPGSYNTIRLLGLAFRPGKVVAQFAKGILTGEDFTITERDKKEFNLAVADNAINNATSVQDLKDKIMNALSGDYPGSTIEDYTERTIRQL